MTIKPGQAWGRHVPRPPDLVVVHSDGELATAISQERGVPIGVGGGDLARTLGVTSASANTLATRPTVNEYPIDLLQVRLDGAEQPIVACAHVVARSPWGSGHWLRGRILVVMNAEFLGEWDIAPRGHPNDGRVEVVDVDASMSARERLAARRRLPTGTHVPHPGIATASVRVGSWQFDRPLDVVIDGRRVARASRLSIDVLADAATVYA
ncbi:MAG TPA: hypothetical protein VMW33_04860 [Ilumatobacteraceae bacterium]|nr:hypothetical protein [Ilumatobacteraceae bacterium]